MEDKPLRVVELFAGVGGFRLGLAKRPFKVVWSNQWEPSTKKQHASMVYQERFGAANHSTEDIANVPTASIPDHDLLCGGFPCQDYSVATTLNNSKGLKGKKGVLWWSIYRILEEKKVKPKYLLLENVDRLLKSPASQRGRDFAIMLQGLNQLGYAVEWRIINAADYGMPQRRRRVFFIGYHQSSELYHKLRQSNEKDWLLETGVLPQAFPVSSARREETLNRLTLPRNMVDISQTFNLNGKKSPFGEAGLMVEGLVASTSVKPHYIGRYTTLGEVLQTRDVPEQFFVNEEQLQKWKYLKGSKKIERFTKEGHSYWYSEGGMAFPDSLQKSARTIITGEGGQSPSRFKHIIETKDGRYRRLTPLELERLNMFPDHHTKLEGISDTKRAFFMGNALVIGIVERIAEVLSAHIFGGK